ncbi:proton-coupled folate transporter-like [Toxorhynchites rutilus septentrionalis]|uniref:proton-coupled folate transporter-like n=1 Tax=Toxorhynchites rutilus septentrionalis TaxID=329112 RepID=UPI002478E6BE|nr:proton-coupled folate transporter-like [Toxorhynchites rutilus septentrionalis]
MDESTFSSGSMCSSAEEEILASEGLRLSRSARWRERSTRHVSFEPAMFLFCFAITLSEIELTHQFIYQTCQVQGIELNECSLVGPNGTTSGTQKIETDVRPAAASSTIAIAIIKFVIPTFGALLLAAWSDRYGRKPVVIIAACGMLLTYFSLTGLNFLSTFVQVNPWFYVLAYIPFFLPGGMIILAATVYAFVSDLSNDHNRTVKMGFMNASILAGSLTGSFCSRYIAEFGNATITCMAAAGAALAGLIYIALFVEDSIIPSSDSEIRTSLTMLCSSSLIRDIMQAVGRKRTRYFWAILCLIIGSVSLTKLAVGSSSVAYTFVHRKLEWNVKQYNQFILIENSLMIVANIVGILLLKNLLDWPDIMVALASVVGFVVSSTIKGFASSGRDFYIASGVTFFKGMHGAALLSVCVYLLLSNDIAKFYAATVSIVRLVPLASEHMYSAFYDETVENYPEAYNFLAAGIYGVCGLALGVMQWLLSRRTQPDLLL